MSCRICNLASRSLIEGSDGRFFDLGSVEEVRRRSGACPSCRQIVDIYDKGTIDKAAIDKHTDVSLYLHAYTPSHVFGLWVSWNDQSVGQRQSQGVKVLGTVGNQTHDLSKLDSPYIDLERPRGWLDICDEQHRGQCHHLPNWKKVDPLEDILLVDTEQDCLVQRPGATKYFALSYLWGSIPEILETKMSNVDHLKQRGAFTSKGFGPLLPRTIRDSIMFVRALGERYIWIDRFCIIQNHPAKHSIISHIDAVYANAYCTITVADGNDADCGLQGVGRPRTTIPQTIDLPQCLLVVKPDHGPHSKYFTRGWTYQELHLSPRQLIFANGTVFWACQSLFWSEQKHGELEDNAVLELFELPFLNWPNLTSWESLIANYNWRDLSFEEDAHVAFSGIERMFERSFPGGFLYGLPEFFFDLTLLWYPTKRVKRRVKPSADNGYCLPSWSWLGWHGKVNAIPWNPISDYVHVSRETTNQFRADHLVDWVQLGPQAGQERRVRNDYHIWRARGERQSSVPKGWTCLIREQISFYSSALNPRIPFRYPLPSTVELPPEDEQRTWPPYLRLCTHRAFFTMRPCGFKRVLDTMVLLADENSRWAGVLFLHIDSQDAPFGESCELVAVSRGRIEQEFEHSEPATYFADLYWEDIPKINGIYEFYNVLWVKWEGDHVIREGVGRVEKSIWEEQRLEPIDTQFH